MISIISAMWSVARGAISGAFDAERVEVFPEGFDIGLDEFVDRLICFCASLMMRSSTSVKFITCVTFTLIFQITPQNIAERERTEIADVRKTPNRRPANVHLYIIAL